MTKHIRIENADTSDHKVLVEIWENEALPILVKSMSLDYPTSMLTETLWQGRWLVIKEKAPKG